MKFLKFLFVGLLFTGLSIASFAQTERIYISICEVSGAKFRKITVVKGNEAIESVDLPLLAKVGADGQAIVIATVLDKYLAQGYNIENSVSGITTMFYVLKKED